MKNKPVKKPLYLDQADVKRIEWDAGALKIYRKRHAPAWAPLIQISHISLFGLIDWQGEALQHCLQAGISIDYISSQGKLGRLTPVVLAKPHLETTLPALVEQYPQQVENWFDAQQQKRNRQLIKRFGLKRASCEKKVKEVLLQRVFKHCYYHWEADLPILAALLNRHISLLLGYFGFDPESAQTWRLTTLLEQLHMLDYWQWAASGDLPQRGLNRCRVAWHHRHQHAIETRLRHSIRHLWQTLQQ